MILILVSSIVDFSFQNKFFFSINISLKENWRKFWQNKAFSVITLLFFSVAISIFWSDDVAYWSERLRIRLPFLALPIAFAWLPKMKKRNYLACFYFLLLLLSFTMIGVLVNYALDFKNINETLFHGKNIPVPMNHIRFSLLLAFSIVNGVILYHENFYLKYKWEQKLIFFCTIFLFVGIHILTVRSGLTCLYIAIAILGMRYIWLTKRYVLLFVLFGFLFFVPYLAYYFVPSVQNKIRYALYDLEQFREGKGANYSDSERIGSILAGLKVGNDNPILGCGYGDLDRDVNIAYRAVFSQEKEPKIPHNQYVMTYAGLGIVGLCLFLYAIFYPIFYQKNYQDNIFLALNIILICSFLAEATIETQAGTAMYCLFLCMGIGVEKSKNQ
jgi:O-antigen ligase